MAERLRFQSETASPAGGPHPPSAPGAFIREFGRRLGWEVSTCNVMVEGTTDVAYFKIAARLYHEATKMSLIGDGLSVFAVGDRDGGGTSAMLQFMPALRRLLPTDPIDANGQHFRFIVLLDSDAAGRGMARTLTGKSLGLAQNRDVFLLQRVLPRDTRDPHTFDKRFAELNKHWHSIDCEIEDLIQRSVLDAFVQANPSACKRPPDILDGAHHYEWYGYIKPALCRFVEQYAMVSDVQLIINLLQSLRYMLELQPDGSLPAD